jgi:tRNA G18 (ribose-2'-O)-methylase SpoU
MKFSYILDMRKLTHDEIAVHRTKRSNINVTPRVPIDVLVDNVRSLYNVGSIFRTSDGAWIRKLFLCGYTPHPPRKEIEKTALGATGTVPWEYRKDALEAVQELKQSGDTICVLEQTTKSIPYSAIQQSNFPLCLVIGNEITGVSHKLVETADMAIDIPMIGTKQSLNVAVAFGIAIFELAYIYRSGVKPRIL